jgi:hypothetical protein
MYTIFFGFHVPNIPDMNMALSRRCCHSRLPTCGGRLLLFHQHPPPANSATAAAAVRHKYTAPSFNEILNSRRTKFNTMQPHKTEHVEKVTGKRKQTYREIIRLLNPRQLGIGTPFGEINFGTVPVPKRVR